MNETAAFFDELQRSETYKHLKTMTRGADRAAADFLNQEVRGRTLSVGGVWEFFEPGPGSVDLTCLDLSEEMLKSYAPAGAKFVIGDLFDVALPEAAFDSMVFTLLLHHLAEGDYANCCRRVDVALRLACRWLKPGGRVFIVEYCPAPAWMPAQRLLLPLTKWFLRLARMPLVFLHERGFYEASLAANGFCDITARRIHSPGVSEWTWFPIFLGVPWLRMPIKLYPKMHVFTGRKSEANDKTDSISQSAGWRSKTTKR
jgi:SAM-dependent methyltransferase